MNHFIARLLFVVPVVIGNGAAAAIPEIYHPVAIKPPFSFSARVFDISPALAQARREGKPIFLYLGASDCSTCREYERFLQMNQIALTEKFSGVIVVDLVTRTRGRPIQFKVQERRYTFDEFRKLVGDERKFLTYPYYWLLSPDLKQLKQLSQSMDPYLNVASHLRLLEPDSGPSRR